MIFAVVVTVYVNAPSGRAKAAKIAKVTIVDSFVTAMANVQQVKVTAETATQIRRVTKVAVKRMTKATAVVIKMSVADAEKAIKVAH